MIIQRPKPFTLLVILHFIIVAAAIFALSRRPSDLRSDRETIVVIPVDGVISMSHGSVGRGSTVDELVAAIDDLSEKKEVRALVLKINSPGGSVGAVQALYEAITRFRQTGRPVVSTFGDIAASGGYYIACAGDRIVAHPGTLTGSIGVVMQLPNVTGLMQKIGVSMNTVTSGEMKDAGSPFRTMSAAERAYFKSLIDDAYGQFFEAVGKGRNLQPDALRPLADGRVFSGQMAMKVKLVDEMGGQKEAVEIAKKLAGLEGKNPRVFERKEKPSLERILRLISRSPISGMTALAEPAPQLLYQAQ